jgi:iron complex transport system substrate-binding protein
MPRIVSLIASATEMVHSLGLIDHLVGRSHECDFPAGVLALPVCTAPAIAVNGNSADIDRCVKERVANALSVYDVFDDVLDQLQPTHILTQTQCRVCAVSLEDVQLALSRSISSRPKLVALEPNTLDDIWDDLRRVAAACDIASQGDTVIEQLKARMRDISGRAIESPRRPKVACIEWQEPLMASGNWMPELLELAGGQNLFGKPGAHSPWMSWDDLAAADPDVIIIMPCGFDLERTRREMYWLTGKPDWLKLQAVRGEQVYLVDGNQYMNRPGPRVVESLRILAEILHPDTFAPSLRGAAWEPL